MLHFTDFTGYVLFIITSFLAGVESADQCLLNSKVLSCFYGVIMSIRSFFLLTAPVMKSNKDSNEVLLRLAHAPTITHKNQEPKTTHNDENVALVLLLAGGFAIWNNFQ